MSKQTWSYAKAKGIAEAVHGDGAAYSELNIVRLAPGDRQLQVDWSYEGICGADEHLFVVKLASEEVELQTMQVPGTETGIRLTGLDNDRDYSIGVQAVKTSSRELLAESPIRLARMGVVPGTVINYIHPEDYTYGFSGRSPASPSIVKLPDGVLIASHDVYWQLEGQNLTKLFRSADGGKSWTFLCDLYPCFWGKLFLHRGSLYMLGTSTEYGALLIGRSDDGGETWSAPAQLLPEGSREERGPHRAPMPVVEHKGRLWTAVEFGSWQTGGHATGAISVPADADLLDPSSWTATPFLPYNHQWPGTIEGGEKTSLLEGNIVIAPGGKLVNLLRYHTREGNPAYGKAIILEVSADRPEAPLTFGRVIDFHGNLSKFTVHYDSISSRYWSLINPVTTTNLKQRNILSLVSSEDLIHWHIHRDILNYQDNGWPEDNRKVGFQYLDWFFDGDNIVFASRTAINGAYNYHNANYLTCHLIENFRSL